MGEEEKPTDNLLRTSQYEVVLEYTGSLSFDHELYFWDIVGSLAHIKSLEDAGVLSDDDHRSLREGLTELLMELNRGSVELRPELEDIHMNIEALLTDKIGDVAGKLHTGRSRNDQVSLDLRLYSRERILETLEELVGLQKVLLAVAKGNTDTVMPGFTHLQPAQPVTLAHHMMAHWHKLRRDFERLVQCYDRMNLCPLGAGALAGNTFPVDRHKMAELLGFRGPTENSMDTVSDRDFVTETIFCMSMIQLHLSSIAEEIIIWNNPQFGFVTLSPQLTTGSSMMPQKRNPDIAELARGKTGRVAGDLVTMIMVLKGLPLTYNRDLQEDKEPLFDAFDSVVDSLWAIRSLMSTAKFDSGKMREACMSENLTATDLADYLVGKGVPFRTAYIAVKEMVQASLKKGVPIEKWPLSNMREYNDLFGEDVLEYIKPETAIERRKVFGGPSSSSVKKNLEIADQLISQEEKEIARISEDVQGTISRLFGESLNLDSPQ